MLAHRTIGWVMLLAMFAATGSAEAPRRPRREPAGERSPVAGPAAAHYRKQAFTTDGQSLTYYLMTPADVKAATKYPLVVCLHGRGGNTQAAAVLGRDDMRRAYPCFALAPASAGGRWAMSKSSKRGDGGAVKMPLVVGTIEKLVKELPIDADRIYVTGQSMGGFGSFGAVAARPDLFAAAAPICGGWDTADAGKMARVPVWAFHGEKDGVVPARLSREMVEALKAAGGSARHTEYPGVNHNSWTRAYGEAELWEWMFKQRRQRGG